MKKFTALGTLSAHIEMRTILLVEESEGYLFVCDPVHDMEDFFTSDRFLQIGKGRCCHVK